jgi:hypothetical protein
MPGFGGESGGNQEMIGSHRKRIDPVNEKEEGVL